VYVLDEAMAFQAIDLVAPVFHGMCKAGVAKRSHLYMGLGLRVQGPRGMRFHALATRAYGDRKEWEHRYDRIANSKGDITARTGRPSREVQLMSPELLDLSHDTVHGGSWIEGNIIGFCSGIQGWLDEALSKCLVGTAKGLCHTRVDELRQAARYDFFNLRERRGDPPLCMECGVLMLRAGSMFACPSCGKTSE
jgi:rubrerythrin